MTLGAVPFSIYQTYTPEQIQYLISDSGARVALVEQAYLDRMLEARKELPDLEHVIVVDGEAPEGVTPLAEVEGSNPDFDVEASWRAIKPEDLLTLIYTSGTTGPPKGVQLSHANMMDVVASVEEIIGLPEGHPGHLLAARRRTSPSATPTTTSRSCSPARSRAARTRARS